MGKTCTFFGNARVYESIGDKVSSLIEYLIENMDVDTFYVGVHGSFEAISYTEVIKMKEHKYPHIRIICVAAYASDMNKVVLKFDDFVYPIDAEFCPRRYSIIQRNNWLIKNSNYIISYNNYRGRAFEFCQKALTKGIPVFEITKRIISPLSS